MISLPWERPVEHGLSYLPFRHLHLRQSVYPPQGNGSVIDSIFFGKAKHCMPDFGMFMRCVDDDRAEKMGEGMEIQLLLFAAADIQPCRRRWLSKLGGHMTGVQSL